MCCLLGIYNKKYYFLLFNRGIIKEQLFHIRSHVTNKALPKIKRGNCYEKEKLKRICFSPFSPDLGT